LRSEFARALLIKFVDLRNRHPYKLGKIFYELPVRVGELVNVEIPSKHLDCSNAPCSLRLQVCRVAMHELLFRHCSVVHTDNKKRQVFVA